MNQARAHVADQRVVLGLESRVEGRGMHYRQNLALVTGEFDVQRVCSSERSRLGQRVPGWSLRRCMAFCASAI